MRRVFSTLHNHRHFVIVATLLTLVMTFPTVVYIFRMDVFWLPTGTASMFIAISGTSGMDNSS